MQKIVTKSFIRMMTASLLVGCGSNATQTNNTPSTSNPNSSTPKKFGSNIMPILTAQCKNCHGENGRFMITSTNATYNNIHALKSPMTAAGQYLLDKASGTLEHGGGVRFSTSSTQYSTIKSWIDAGAPNN